MKGLGSVRIPFRKMVVGEPKTSPLSRIAAPRTSHVEPNSRSTLHRKPVKHMAKTQKPLVATQDEGWITELLHELNSSEEGRRAVQRERLFVLVLETIQLAMSEREVSKSELARRLKKPKSFVSRLFTASNLTLQTIADVFAALECELCLGVRSTDDIWECSDIQHSGIQWVGNGPRRSGSTTYSLNPDLAG